MSKTVLFFDLDGTLMVNPFGKVVFPKVSAMLATAANIPQEAAFAAILAEHDHRVANPLPDRPRTMDWDDIFASVAAMYGVQYHDSVEEMVKAHAGPPYSAAIDDAPEVLRTLADNGRRKLVAASMGLSRYQLPVLKALDLSDCFDDFLMPDNTGCLKMDRAFYDPYLDDATCRIHIGDRYDHDCYYPKQFGGMAVLRLPINELAAYPPLERPRHITELHDQISGWIADADLLPDAIVVHLSELAETIGTLESQFSHLDGCPRKSFW